MAIQYSCQENPHWQRGLVDPGGPWGCKESDTTKHAYTHKDVTAYACMLSRFWLYVTPWTVAHQSPPSIGFSRQEYWSGLPFPSQVIFPTQGLNSSFLAFPALADGLFTTGATWEAQFGAINNIRMGERTSLYNITTSCLRSPESPLLQEESLFVSFAIEAGTPHVVWSRMGCARYVGRGGQSGQVQVWGGCTSSPGSWEQSSSVGTVWTHGNCYGCGLNVCSPD